MDNWIDIRKWRRAQRELLLARRLALPAADRAAAGARIVQRLLAIADELVTHCIGYYWPFKGEIDLHGLIAQLVARGASAALPVVVEKNQAMVFRSWRRGEQLVHGIWNIPVPADGAVVVPTLLLVPLVGFDPAGYRLGYGGGYYDRTLAQLVPRPLTIGIGYAATRLPTIYPQSHDIPMDRLLTEEGWSEPVRAAPAVQEETRTVASSPCQMAEAPASYMGYLEREQILVLLDELLRAERAGARGVAAMAKRAVGTAAALLPGVVRDEAAFVAMLGRHTRALGGEPSPATGDFLHKLLALEDFTAQIALLNRGQAWVARRLREAIPRIAEPALARDLRAMLEVHERNIAACERLLAASG